MLNANLKYHCFTGIASYGLKTEDIQFVVATHGHVDHVGSASQNYYYHIKVHAFISPNNQA